MTYKDRKEQIDNNIFAKARAMMCGEYDEIIDGAEIEELQGRIDKAIKYINAITWSDGCIDCEPEQTKKLLSILQDEEVIENEI